MTLQTTFSSVTWLQSNDSLSCKALVHSEGLQHIAKVSTGSQPKAAGGLCKKVLLENSLALPICHLKSRGKSMNFIVC